MRCFNCKKEGHFVSDCLDPRCYTCAIQFATLADRKEHEKVVHKRHVSTQILCSLGSLGYSVPTSIWNSPL
jgi:hypothetical protein